MTGLPDNNRDAFLKIEKLYREKGYEVINPIVLSDCLDVANGKVNNAYEDYMRYGLSKLIYCDAIVMFGDWKESRGALFEKQVAEFLGIEIIYHRGDGNA